MRLRNSCGRVIRQLLPENLLLSKWTIGIVITLIFVFVVGPMVMGHYQRVLNENLVRRIFAKAGPLRNIVHEQSASGPIGSFVYFETERSLTLDGWWQPYDFRGAAEFQLRAERFIPYRWPGNNYRYFWKSLEGASGERIYLAADGTRTKLILFFSSFASVRDEPNRLNRQ